MGKQDSLAALACILVVLSLFAAVASTATSQYTDLELLSLYQIVVIGFGLSAVALAILSHGYVGK